MPVVRRQHVSFPSSMDHHRRRSSRRRQRRCQVIDFFTKVKIFKRSLPDDGTVSSAVTIMDETEGRDGDGSCEIHINGDYIFVAIALLGAGLAYITYTTITAGRRKRSTVEAAVGHATVEAAVGHATVEAAVGHATVEAAIDPATSMDILLGIHI
jgi:hypothetical protein